MNTAIIVLLLLCIFPFVMATIAGVYRRKQLGNYDNKNPRGQYAELTGVGARAVAAQQNCWEALAIYSAALLAVFVSGAQPTYLAMAAVVVLVCRVLYCIFYLANIDLLRSLIFGLSILPSFYWFYVAITHS